MSGTVTVAPANKRMVIQTVSLVRLGGISTAGTVQAILTTSIFGVSGSFPMLAAEAPFRGISMATTLYGGAGQPVTVGISRYGAQFTIEIMVVTITGYYVDKPQ